MRLTAFTLPCLIWTCYASRLRTRPQQRTGHAQHQNRLLQSVGYVCMSLHTPLAAWCCVGRDSLHSNPYSNKRSHAVIGRDAHNGLVMVASVLEPTMNTSGAVSNSDGLLAWASSQGCELGAIRIANSSFGGGDGVFATRNIQSGEVLLRVPKAMCLDQDKAVADVECGDFFKKKIEDGDTVAALCAFIAKQRLCGNSFFAPYLATICQDSSDYLQFWSEEELKHIGHMCGSAVYNQAVLIRKDVESAVAFALGIEPLRVCVKRALVARGINCTQRELNQRIADEVRAAHAFVLSRAFGVSNGVLGSRQLIPVISSLQHEEPQTVKYAWESFLTDSGVIVRALCDIPAGQELTISYGEHPDYIFASHYGFVPSASSESRSRKGQTMLTLSESIESGNIGSSIAMAAQLQAAELAIIDSTSADARAEDESSPTRLKGQLELARLLSQALEWARNPLTFVVSNEMIDQAATDAAAGTKSSNKHGLAAFLACTRLCALDAIDLAQFVEDSQDPNEELEAMLQQLLHSADGRLSKENDRKAAELVRKAAKERLLEVEGQQPSSSTGKGEACLRLTKALRDSEEIVLQRLANEDGAERLFVKPSSASSGDGTNSEEKLAAAEDATQADDEDAEDVAWFDIIFDIVSWRFILDSRLDCMLRFLETEGKTLLSPNVRQTLLQTMQTTNEWKKEVRTPQELQTKVEIIDVMMEKLVQRQSQTREDS